MIIRDAILSDATFLAKCVMAGMHFYDFESDIPKNIEIYRRLTECERRGDLLYTYKNSRVAEEDGVVVGSILSYPGEIYKDLRHRTFTELWPDIMELDTNSDLETGPGEYYLDTLAVLPSYRGRGIGRALIQDAIERGLGLGYEKITLVVDPDMPQLITLYSLLGFTLADHRHVFGIDFQRMVYSKQSPNKASELSGNRDK